MSVKSLFNATDNDEIVDRIHRLHADSKSAWGKMDVAQMLAHLQVPITVALGEAAFKRSMMGYLFGVLAKKKLSNGKPWQKNLPTDKHFVIREKGNFEEERTKLISFVRRFAQSGPAGISMTPHPFFGKMTAGEWDAITMHHLDHHLRQFGV